MKNEIKHNKLVIASSSKFQEEIQEWRQYFSEQGYEVINYPKKINQENVEEYKNVYIEFFKFLDETDYLFVINAQKNMVVK